MEKQKIAVIFGGTSSEHEISLQSACSVVAHLDKNKYEPVLLGITKDGSWYRYYGSEENLLDDKWIEDESNCSPAILSPSRDVHGIVEVHRNELRKTAIDVVFPVLHGKNGEDGTVQGLITLAGIPLVGCDVLSSALCMDKYRAHKLAASVGIKVAKSVVISDTLDKKSIFSQAEQLKYPLFVKPLRNGSSFGISKIGVQNNLIEAVLTAFQYDSCVIIEENIDGFEVGCAVMGNDILTVGEVDEIELNDGFFDFKEKYTLCNSKIHMPAKIDGSTAKRIKETAMLIYKALGCTGFARVDMFLASNGDIFFNEVNTIPGFTAHSRFPNMMQGIGLSYTALLDKLIEFGMKR